MANTQSNPSMRPKKISKQKLPNNHPKLARAAKIIMDKSNKLTNFSKIFRSK